MLTGLLSAAPAVTAYTQPRPFDGDSAFQHLEKQCSFGPRSPGGAGHQACLDWFVAYFRSLGLEPTLQRFTADDPRSDATFSLTNVIVPIRLGGEPPVMLCAHWDTRPVADRESDPTRRNLPIPGANDGASGVAVLLEIAGIAASDPSAPPLLIVLFDGEDIGREGHNSEYALGSRYWAKNITPQKPSEAILLDMIGDRELSIPVEGFSETMAPRLRRAFWESARATGSEAFSEEIGGFIEDDHVPLLKAGIPAIDVIDFDYPYWHTLADTPDKCSPESLRQVGEAILHYIYHRR